jgi:hypothetical protein
MEKIMTAKKNATPASNYFATVTEALENVQSKIEVPAAARDFVKKGASTAKERVETAHEGALKFANGAEKLALSFVGGYANFARGVIDAAVANVQHGLNTVEKVAGAKSINEAVTIQVEAARESANANMERARTVAETARTAVTEGAKEVQAQLSKLYSFDKKAA